MRKKKYNNCGYIELVWDHFKLRWNTCHNMTSNYGEEYDLRYSGYNLDRIKGVRGIIYGPEKTALKYTKEIRGVASDRGYDPSLDYLKENIDEMLDKAIVEGKENYPGPPYYGWR